MSDVVENKVVQLEFDNSRFEKNVEQSIKSINELKESLVLGPKTQTAITDSVNKIDLSGLANQVDNIAYRFSTFGIAGMTAIQRITNAAIDLGLTLERKVVGVFGAAWNQIITGGTSRAANIEQATFQLKGIFGEQAEGQVELQMAMTGTSEQIKELTGLTEDLIVAENAANYAVADTAYGLDSAAKAASVLATSGVDVLNFSDKLADSSGRARTEMQVALRAISGTAAMANSSYDEIAHIFERISGQNRVMGQDLTSLSSRGLNAAAVLANYLNEIGETTNATQADIQDMVSKGKIDFMTFAKAMDEAYGEHAKDANSTFQGAFDNMRFALSKIGADFIAPMREDLIPVLNNVRMTINAVRSSLGPFVDAWKKASAYVTDGIVARFGKLIGYGQTDAEWKGSDQWVTAIKNITNVVQIATDTLFSFLNFVDSIVHPITEAWKEIFPSKGYDGFVNFLNKLKDFIDRLVLTGDAMNKLNRIAKGFFSIFKIIGQIISAATTAFIGLFRSLSGVGSSFSDILAKFGDFLTEIAKSNKVFNTATTIFQFLAEVITNFSGVVAKAFDSISKSISGISDKFKDLKIGMGKEKSFEIPALKGINDSFNGLGERFQKFKDMLSGKFKTPGLVDTSKSLGDIRGQLEPVMNYLNSFMDTMKSIVDKLKSMVKFISSKVGEAIKAMFDSIGEIASPNVPAYKKWEGAFNFNIFTLIFGAIGTAIGKIIVFIVKLKTFKKNWKLLFDSMSSILKNFVSASQGVAKTLTAIPQIFTNLSTSIKEATKALKVQATTQMLKTITIALVAFVAAVFVLSKIDATKAISGMIAVIIIFEYLKRAMTSLNTIDWNLNNLNGSTKAIKSLITMSLSVILIAMALSKITKAFGKNPAGAVFALASIYVVIQMFMRVMKLFGQVSFNNVQPKVIAKFGLMMIGFGIAVKLIASAISTITKSFDRNWMGAAFALVSIYVIIQLMIKTINQFTNGSTLRTNPKAVAKLGLAMMEIGASMVLFATAIRIIAKAFSNNMASSVLAVITVLILMKMTVKTLQDLSNSIGNKLSGIIGIQAVAFAMIGVATSLAIFGAAILMLAKSYGNNAVATVEAVGTVLVLMYAVTKILGEMKTKKVLVNSIAMINVAISLALIGKAIANLAQSFSQDGLATLLALAASIAMIGSISVILSKMDSKKALTNGASMLQVAFVLKMIASAIADLSKTFSTNMVAGLAAFGTILALLIGMSVAIGVIDPKKAAVNAGALLAFAAALTVVAFAVKTIGKMDFKSVLLGIGSLVVIIGLFAGFAALVGVFPAIGAGLAIITASLVGIGVAALAAGAGFALLGVGLMALSAALSVGLPLLVNGITATLTAIAQMIPTVAAGLANGLLIFIEIILDHADVIVNLVMTIVRSVIQSISSMIPQISQIMLSLLLGVLDLVAKNIGPLTDKLISIIVNLLNAISARLPEINGAISDFITPIFGYLIEFISGLLSIVAEGIGEIFGSFIGSLINGIAKSLDKESMVSFGTTLSEFMLSLKPFIDGLQGLDESTARAALMLAAVITILTADDIIRSLTSWLTGGNSMTKFGQELAAFGPYIKQYADSVKGLDVAAVEASTYAAQMLADFARTIPNEGGLIAKIFGDNDIESFGEKLAKFGPYIKSYADSVKGLDVQAVQASTNAAQMIADFARTIPNEGGLIAKITGDNDIRTFGSELKSFGKHIAEYADEVKGIDSKAVESSVNAAKMITEFAATIPNSGGLVSIFTGDNTIDKFGQQLALFGLAISNYYNYIKNVDTEALSRITSSLISLFDILGIADNLGKNSVNNFSSILQELANAGIEGFLNIIAVDSSDSIRSSVEKFAENVKNAFATETDSIVEQVKLKGKDVATGFANGIKDQTSINAVTSAASELGDAAVTALGDSIGDPLEEPATEVIPCGHSFDLGFDEGIKDYSNYPISTAGGLAESVTNALQSGNIGAYSAGYNLVSNYKAGQEDAAKALKPQHPGYFTPNLGATLPKELPKQSAIRTIVENQAAMNFPAAASDGYVLAGDRIRGYTDNVDDAKESTEELQAAYQSAAGSANNLSGATSGVGSSASKASKDVDSLTKKIETIMNKYEDLWDTAKDRANKDLFKGVDKQGDKFLDSVQDIMDKYKDIYSSAVEMTNSQDLFAEVKMEDEAFAPETLLNNLEDQVNQVNELNTIIGSLSGRIADNGLRAAISNMSVDDLPELRALYRMDNSQLSKYEAMYQKKVQANQNKIQNELTGSLSQLTGQYTNIATYVATDTSTNQLLHNLQAQVNQLNDYNATVASLTSRIKDVNLREAIAQMGVESIDELKQLNRMTDTQLDEYVELYNQKIASGAKSIKQELSTELSALLNQPIDIDEFYATYQQSLKEVGDKVSEGGDATRVGRTTGSEMAEGTVEGLNDSQVIAQASNTGKDITNAIAEGTLEENGIEKIQENITSILNKVKEYLENEIKTAGFAECGGKIVDKITSGIIRIRDSRDFQDEIYRFADKIEEIVLKREATFENTGAHIINGIIIGMNSRKSYAISTASAIAASIVNAVKNITKVHSPSRVFMEIGKFMDEGLAIGLRDNSKVAENAAGEMAEGSVSAVQNAIQQLSGMLDGSIDVNPVITPTLDLSQVNARSAALASMFDTRRIAVQARNDEQQTEMLTKLGNIMAEQNERPNVTFNQTNNSPKALSRTEIYRQTRNGFSQLASAIQ